LTRENAGDAEAHAGISKLTFFLLLGMDDLFHPAHHAAEAKGFIAAATTRPMTGSERAAEYLLEQLRSYGRRSRVQRVALIADGEVSSPVTGNGIGGRNSEFVLACVEQIAGKRWRC